MVMSRKARCMMGEEMSVRRLVGLDMGRLWKCEGLEFRVSSAALKDLESLISDRLTSSGGLTPSTCLSLRIKK